MAREVSRGLDVAVGRLGPGLHELVRRALQVAVQGHHLAAGMAPRLDHRPTAVAAVAGDDRGVRGIGVRVRRLASRPVHGASAVLHAADRLLAREHAHPRAGLRLRADLTRDRAVRRHPGVQVTPLQPGRPAVARPDADVSDFRLPPPDHVAVRLRRGGRSDCERDLRQPPDGEERHSGACSGCRPRSWSRP